MVQVTDVSRAFGLTSNDWSAFEAIGTLLVFVAAVSIPLFQLWRDRREAEARRAIKRTHQAIVALPVIARMSVVFDFLCRCIDGKTFKVGAITPLCSSPELMRFLSLGQGGKELLAAIPEPSVFPHEVARNLLTFIAGVGEFDKTLRNVVFDQGNDSYAVATGFYSDDFKDMAAALSKLAAVCRDHVAGYVYLDQNWLLEFKKLFRTGVDP